MSVDLDPRWSEVVHAAGSLTRTPTELGADDVQRLRQVGLWDDELADLVFAASFFNWANRLMLSLVKPAAPASKI